MSGTRKHLDLLLNDYDASARARRGETPESPTKQTRVASEREASITAEHAADLVSRQTEEYWLPPYEKAAREREKKKLEAMNLGAQPQAREVAMSVNNRRTPSGNFFSTVNPSLHRKDESEGRKSLDTMREELSTIELDIDRRRAETLQHEQEVMASLGEKVSTPLPVGARARDPVLRADAKSS